MQERFIEWVNEHESSDFSVNWVPMIEMSREFRAKREPTAGAKMPRGFRKE